MTILCKNKKKLSFPALYLNTVFSESLATKKTVGFC